MDVEHNLHSTIAGRPVVQDETLLEAERTVDVPLEHGAAIELDACTFAPDLANGEPFARSYSFATDAIELHSRFGFRVLLPMREHDPRSLELQLQPMRFIRCGDRLGTPLHMKLLPSLALSAPHVDCAHRGIELFFPANSLLDPRFRGPYDGGVAIQRFKRARTVVVAARWLEGEIVWATPLFRRASEQS